MIYWEKGIAINRPLGCGEEMWGWGAFCGPVSRSLSLTEPVSQDHDLTHAILIGFICISFVNSKGEHLLHLLAIFGILLLGYMCVCLFNSG